MVVASIVGGWKERLVGLAQNAPYVFIDTPADLIEEHYCQLTTFIGYPEDEIAAAENRLKVVFPDVFRGYLREMGKSPGDLFRGSDLASIGEFERYRSVALALLAQTDPAMSLPAEAIVFLFHQGYSFLYLLALGGEDAPTMQWREMQQSSRQAAASFAELVDAELGLMERVTRDAREKGGYYLTLHAGGGESQTHPALSSGERPLDRVPAGHRWWQD